VALSGDKDNVVGPSSLERKVDGSGAVRFDGVVYLAGFESGLDLSKDCTGIFRARVVAGGNHEITSLTRGVTHFGSFRAVAVTATAKEGDDAAIAGDDKLASECGEIAESVVSVRVVDDDSERLAGVDRLETAGHGFEMRNRVHEFAEADASSVSGSEGGEKIEDVDLAGKA
jgi:hypothetical protein